MRAPCLLATGTSVGNISSIFVSALPYHRRHQLCSRRLTFPSALRLLRIRAGLRSGCRSVAGGAAVFDVVCTSEAPVSCVKLDVILRRCTQTIQIRHRASEDRLVWHRMVARVVNDGTGPQQLYLRSTRAVGVSLSPRNRIRCRPGEASVWCDAVNRLVSAVFAITQLLSRQRRRLSPYNEVTSSS